MIEKTFEGWLSVNWKTGAMKIVKRKPKNNHLQIPVHLSIKVKTPEPKSYKAKGEITMTETKMDEILIEEI